MTAPIKFSDIPPELRAMAFAEANKITPFVPTINVLAMRVRFACDEIGRQWRIAQVQK